MINSRVRATCAHQSTPFQTNHTNASRKLLVSALTPNPSPTSPNPHFCVHVHFCAGPPRPDHRASGPAHRFAGSVHMYERHLGRRHSGGHRSDYIQHMESTSPVSSNNTPSNSKQTSMHKNTKKNACCTAHKHKSHRVLGSQTDQNAAAAAAQLHISHPARRVRHAPRALVACIRTRRKCVRKSIIAKMRVPFANHVRA